MKKQLIKDRKKQYVKPVLKRIPVKIKDKIFSSSGGGSTCGGEVLPD